MRVAVVPLQYTRGFRALNLTRLQRAIVRAAELEPAPDLLVLPAWPEDWFIAEHPALFTSAMCEGHVAALSHLAREWGIWIAAGCTVPAGMRGDLGAVLLDPDGDVCARVSHGNGAGGVGTATAGAGWHIESTPLARIAIVGGLRLDRALAQSPDCSVRPDLLLVLATTDQVRNAHERLAHLARSAGAWVCLSTAALSDAAPPAQDAFGLILDPIGATIVDRPHAGTRVLVADLPIAPPPATDLSAPPDSTASAS